MTSVGPLPPGATGSSVVAASRHDGACVCRCGADAFERLAPFAAGPARFQAVLEALLERP